MTVAPKAPREHILKCWSSAFDAIADGRKRFEWRKDDRDFNVGDILVLRKWDPHLGTAGDFVGWPEAKLRVRVTYILRGMFGVPDGYCVMSIELIREPRVSGAEYVEVPGCACVYRTYGCIPGGNTERITENCPVHRPLDARALVPAELPEVLPSGARTHSGLDISGWTREQRGKVGVVYFPKGPAAWWVDERDIDWNTVQPVPRRPHINAEGQFQSDKYPTTPPGKVPLSVKDPVAQPHLWQYAEAHRTVDAEFSDDLQFALREAGYVPPEKFRW